MTTALLDARTADALRQLDDALARCRAAHRDVVVHRGNGPRGDRNARLNALNAAVDAVDAAQLALADALGGRMWNEALGGTESRAAGGEQPKEARR